MSIIFVDKTCGLSKQDIKKVGLELIEWSNNCDLSYVFAEAFNEAMSLDEDIIYLHPARKMSTHVINAINFKRNAASNYKRKFLLIDCGTVGAGYGLSAYMLGIQNKNYKSTLEQVNYLKNNKFATMRFNIQKNNTINAPIYKIYDSVETKLDVANGINSAKNKMIALMQENGENIFDYYILVVGNKSVIVDDFVHKINRNDKVISCVTGDACDLEVAFHV